MKDTVEVTVLGVLGRRAVRTLTWAAAVGVVAVVVAVLSGGERNIVAVLLAALDGWAVLGVASAAAGVAVLRRLGAPVLRPAVATAVAAVLTVAVLPPWPQGGASTATATRFAPLRVTALNLQFGRADTAQVMAVLRRDVPDVLVLTELTPTALAALRADGLELLLPYAKFVARSDAAGTGVWSRSPLQDAQRLAGLQFVGIRARITVEGTPVTVYGLHPPPPFPVQRWKDDYAELERLVGQSVADGGEVVLAGDLNAGSRNGPLVRLLDVGLRDAGSATAWSWQGRTWPRERLLPQMIRIDHVLATPAIGVDTLETFAVDGTDHRGVTSLLSVPAS